MPVKDQGPAEVMLRIRHRISAKEGNRGNRLCRFNRGRVVAAALIGMVKGGRGSRGDGSDGVTQSF